MLTPKQFLRRQMRLRKAAMTPEEILQCSETLTRLFLQTEAYRRCTSLYGYLPFNQEVRTSALLQQALSDGKQVALPKCYGETMKFIHITDLTRVRAGAFGAPEPEADAPLAADPEALVLVPGLAFDPDGHRLGYGGGFYDRFLAEEPGHPTIALCYDFQMVPHLDHEPHDIPVDIVLQA